VSTEGSPLGLSQLSQRELRDLLRAIDGGWLTYPLSELALSSAGIVKERCAELARLLVGLNGPSCRLVIEVAVAERLHRPPPRLDLVWTGPEARGTSARNTRVVVKQLFERAKESVIIGGFAFDHGETLFKPLHERMQAGLDVALFMDIDIRGEDKPIGDGAAYADRAIRRFVKGNWPFGAPFPRIFYDPESAVAGPPWVSLHAKCIVVDDTHAFVTSANFTDRGQTRNIEVGVCIEDRDFAERLGAQWRALIARGLVQHWQPSTHQPVGPGF
jgi:phosphatidylserine/phosphatidylglycerophosphate/cardiolipin synthase-like enzyme